MNNMQTQSPLEDESNIYWVAEDEEKDTDTHMDIQSSEDDEDAIYIYQPKHHAQKR